MGGISEAQQLAAGRFGTQSVACSCCELRVREPCTLQWVRTKTKGACVRHSCCMGGIREAQQLAAGRFGTQSVACSCCELRVRKPCGGVLKLKGREAQLLQGGHPRSTTAVVASGLNL